MENEGFEASVGMSRKWDAWEAGREVAENTLKNIDHKPSFFILYSTIHYEKHGGFKNFLNGVWDVLPEGTPLIGGTVAGFMNNYGCFTRGTSGLAIFSEEMDVRTGIGFKTKKNPIIAAKNCANMIEKGLNESKYNNKFFISLISGGLTFQIPFLGRRRVFQDMPGFLTNITTKMTSYFFSKGPGREEEVLKELSNILDDYYILSGSCMDDNLFLTNYQFYNKNVVENAVVGLGFSTNLSFDIQRNHGLSETNRKLKVTKVSSDKRFIYKINNKPAIPELLNIMSWPDDYMTEQLLHSRTLYYPLGFKHNDEISIDVIALVSGNSLCMVHQLKNEDLYVLSASGKELVSTVDVSLEPFLGNSPLFGLIMSCGIRLDTLGLMTYKVHDKLKKYFQQKPFLLGYVTGEGVYRPNKNLQYGNDTFNLSVFWDR